MFVDKLMILLSEVAVLFPAFLIIFTFRGFFTALVAKLMGDSTAYDESDYMGGSDENEQNLRSVICPRFPNYGFYNIPGTISEKIGDSEIKAEGIGIITKFD